MMMIRAWRGRDEEEEMSWDLITTPNFSFNEYYANSTTLSFPNSPQPK